MRSMITTKFYFILFLISSLWKCLFSLTCFALLSQNNPTHLHRSISVNENGCNDDTIRKCCASFGIGVAICLSTTTFTLPAFALLDVSASASASVSVSSPQIYNNEYADPFHPLCARKIEVSSDGKKFHYSGTAVGPKNDSVLRGCSKNEIELYKLRQGAFDGAILEDGNRLDAGDGVHVGVWESASSSSSSKSTENKDNVRVLYDDVDGVRWNDGNKWIVLKQSEVKKDIATDKLLVVSKKD